MIFNSGTVLGVNLPTIGDRANVKRLSEREASQRLTDRRGLAGPVERFRRSFGIERFASSIRSVYDNHRLVGITMRGLMEEYRRGRQPSELAEEYDLSPSTVARQLRSASGQAVRGPAESYGGKLIPTFSLDKGEIFRR